VAIVVVVVVLPVLAAILNERRPGETDSTERDDRISGSRNVRLTKVDLHALPPEGEFRVYKRLWEFLWDPNLPPGDAAEDEVIKQVASEFDISYDDVKAITVKFFFYETYNKSGKSIEDMTWEEFKRLRDRVGPPR
jgi:hypothetical protein